MPEVCRITASGIELYTVIVREGNGNPLQYSCLENPMDGGAWRPKSLQMVTAAMKLKDAYSLEGKF